MQECTAICASLAGGMGSIPSFLSHNVSSRTLVDWNACGRISRHVQGLAHATLPADSCDPHRMW